MKIGGFFGLTGVSLCLSPVDLSSFKEMVAALDTPTNRSVLAVLHEELRHVKEFLESLPVVYSTPAARKAAAMLKRGRYSSGEEKLELEQILASDTPTLARTVGNSSGELIEMSEPAYKIIQALLDAKDNLEYFYSHTNYSSDTSGVSVFGVKLYLLRSFSEGFLMSKLEKIYKVKSSQKIDQLKKDVQLLRSYCVDSQPVHSDSPVLKIINQHRDLFTSLDCSYFNSLLGLDLTVEDYVAVSKELCNLGLIGFTIFTPRRFKDFCETISLAFTSDLSIVSGTPLYNLVGFLEEVLDNYACVKGVV